MPVMRLYPNGMTAGVPPRLNNHVRAKRGEVEGWSDSATRSNLRFLYSVSAPELEGGTGYGVTLTVRDCPATAQDWSKVRRAFMDRMRRLGMIRMHWVTEWQRRGVPHLHAAIWLPFEATRADSLIRAHWIDLTGDLYGAGHLGQYVLPINDTVGWFQYLSKHAARGASHYQRSALGIPDGWKKKTGRMWGHLGEWPVKEHQRVEMDDAGYYAMRRIVRAWRYADARSVNDPATRKRRMLSARRMLSNKDRVISSLRGVSEWISADMSNAICFHLASRGFVVAWTA